MTRLQGYATSLTAVDDIVSAYASAPVTPPPTVDERWTIFGSFDVPVPVLARIKVSGVNTGPAILYVKIFSPAGQDATLITVESGAEQLHFSQPFEFIPGVIYQIGCSYTGASGVGVIRTVSLVGP